MAANPEAKVFQARLDVLAAQAAARRQESDSAAERESLISDLAAATEKLQVEQEMAQSEQQFAQQQTAEKQQQDQDKLKFQEQSTAIKQAGQNGDPVGEAVKGLDRPINTGNPAAGVGAVNAGQQLSQVGAAGASGGGAAQSILAQLQGGASATPGTPSGQPGTVNLGGQNFPVPQQITEQTQRTGFSPDSQRLGFPQVTRTTKPNVLSADQAASGLISQRFNDQRIGLLERQANANIFATVTEVVGADVAAQALDSFSPGGSGLQGVSDVLRQPGVQTIKEQELDILRTTAEAQAEKFHAQAELARASKDGQIPLSVTLGITPWTDSPASLKDALGAHAAATKAGTLDEQLQGVQALYLQADHVMFPKSTGWFARFNNNDVGATVIPFRRFMGMLAIEANAPAARDQMTQDQIDNRDRLLSLPNILQRASDGALELHDSLPNGRRIMLEQMLRTQARDILPETPPTVDGAGITATDDTEDGLEKASKPRRPPRTASERRFQGARDFQAGLENFRERFRQGRGIIPIPGPVRRDIPRETE